MIPIQVRREHLPRILGAIEHTKYPPQCKEYNKSQGEPEKEPGTETNGFLLREVTRPHAHQDQVHTGPGKGGYATDRGCIGHAEDDRLREARDVSVCRVFSREALEYPSGDGDHHHGGWSVVHPHAHERRCAADAQEQQRRVQRVAAEKVGYLKIQIRN